MPSKVVASLIVVVVLLAGWFSSENKIEPNQIFLAAIALAAFVVKELFRSNSPKTRRTNKQNKLASLFVKQGSKRKSPASCALTSSLRVKKP